MKTQKNNALDKAQQKAGATEKELSAKQRTEMAFKSVDGGKEKTVKSAKGGYLAAIIALGIATLILASALTFTLLMPTESDMTLESSYRKSFYDVMSEVDNMDLNLSKSLNSKDTGAIQSYLLDLAVNSELAENGIQQLPLKDENKFYTSKLINQIGDYAKFLLKKLADGESVSETEYGNLRELYSLNLSLKNSLQNAARGMDDDFSFTESLKDDGGIIVTNLSELENLSTEFPELIYDGPFSDGKDVREIKGLSGDEITEAEAVDIFSATFSEYRLNNVVCVGKTQTGIPCFSVQGERDGDILYAQISVTGGKLIMFSFSGSCNAVNYESSAAEKKCEKFLEDLDLSDMKAVWYNRSNNVYTFNFVKEQENIILYPDMIKIRVCAETCEVIGIEATSYYYNHVGRDIESPTISEETARKKISDGINVETERLCVVPIGNSSEKLCYEFSGESEDGLYYVYIDAATGRQVQMFKVIESTEGTLLM